jgi:hypothetical protein
MNAPYVARICLCDPVSHFLKCTGITTTVYIKSKYLNNRFTFLLTFKTASYYDCTNTSTDRLCGLVVRVLGYKSGGPGLIPDTTRFSEEKKTVLGLERGPLSLVSTTEELLDRKVAAPVKKTENMAEGIRHADHVSSSIRTSWQSLRRQAAVARTVSFARGLRPWSLVLVSIPELPYFPLI